MSLEVKAWTVEFKDEEGQNIVIQIYMTRDQALDLLSKFSDRKIDAIIRDLSFTEASVNVSFEDDSKLFEKSA